MTADFAHLTIILLDVTSTKSSADLLQTVFLGSEESSGALRTPQILERGGHLGKLHEGRGLWMGGVELVSRGRRGRAGWECHWEP